MFGARIIHSEIDKGRAEGALEANERMPSFSLTLASINLDCLAVFNQDGFLFFFCYLS